MEHPASVIEFAAFARRVPKVFSDFISWLILSDKY